MVDSLTVVTVFLLLFVLVGVIGSYLNTNHNYKVKENPYVYNLKIEGWKPKEKPKKHLAKDLKRFKKD